MKKAIKINISGLVFDIDEDAYETLRNYLTSIQVRFRNIEGEQEILADIEARIAELFNGKISGDKEAVNQKDVEEVIAILGEPDQFIDMEDEGELGGQERTERRPYNGRRKMYRDPDEKVIGGICGGLGEYFNIDPVIIRVIFVVITLAYGVGVLIYLLLWIAIPEARTRAEKLEMRGEHINIKNIERSIRQEYENVKTNIKEIPNRESYRRVRRETGGFVRGLGHIILIFIKVIGGIIGVSFVIAGIAILVGIIGTLIAGQTWMMGDLLGWQDFSLPTFLGLFVDETFAILAMICVILVVGIPVLGLIYAGIKLLFPFRANNKAIGLSGLSVWVIALIVLLIFGASESLKYNTIERVVDEKTLPMEYSTIYLMAGTIPPSTGDEMDVNFGYHARFRLLDNGKDLSILGTPDVDIVKSRNGKLELLLKRKARGVNSDVAEKQAGNISYDYALRDSMLVLDPYFGLGKGEKWRDQELDIVLSMPVGMQVFIDESLREYLSGLDNQEDIWSEYMVGDTWVMEEKGLTRAHKETD